MLRAVTVARCKLRKCALKLVNSRTPTSSSYSIHWRHHAAPVCCFSTSTQPKLSRFATSAAHPSNLSANVTQSEQQAIVKTASALRFDAMPKDACNFFYRTGTMCAWSCMLLLRVMLKVLCGLHAGTCKKESSCKFMHISGKLKSRVHLHQLLPVTYACVVLLRVHA